MNQPLLVPRGSSLVLRAGIVTAVVLAFFGIATGLVPLNCLLGACGPQAATSAGPAATASQPPGDSVAIVKDAANVAPRDPQAMAEVAPPASPAPTLSGDDLITGSFALLPDALQKIPEPLKPLAPTALTAKTSRGNSEGPTTRSVRVVAVNPDGTPNLPSSMVEAYAPPAPEAEAAPTAAALAAEAAAKGDTGASAKKSAAAPAGKLALKLTAVPAAPATHDAGSTGVVKGGGVNVRSSPTKGENSVLFSLNGGARITIGESKNGWLHITDKDGRRGWVYKDFVSAN